VIGDFLVGVIALLFALYIYGKSDWLNFSLEFIITRPPAWFFLLPFAWITMLIELYEERRAGSARATFRGIATSALLSLSLYLIFYFFYSTPKSLPRRGMASFIISATILTLIWRMIYIRIFTAPEFQRRVLLVGAGETGQTILQVSNSLHPRPFTWVGIIDDDPKKIGQEIEGLMTFGGNDRLLEMIASQRITDAVVCISGEMCGEMFQALLDARERGVDIIRFPVAYEDLLGRVPIRHLEADWILRSFVDQSRVSGFFELEKRLLDIIGGLIGVSLFLITYPFIALAIVLDSGFPVFYSQVRSGRGDIPYHILKYRTMRQNAEPDGQPQWAEENDRRATRVGRFLRKTHLDELPQFFNVLRGEMSLVGPRAERPELVTWFQQHVPFYRARLLVKPGITGWAQINCGYASTIDETITKLEYDLYYIKHRNLILDLVILLRTPTTMFTLKGR
jgi:exopolysaccharide biosynthesis polyprenyl glycosylphosphotransferase